MLHWKMKAVLVGMRWYCVKILSLLKTPLLLLILCWPQEGILKRMAKVEVRLGVEVLEVEVGVDVLEEEVEVAMVRPMEQ